MQLNEDQVRKTIADMKSHGYVVGLRDISYCVLSLSMDASLAYMSLFGKTPEMPFEKYSRQGKMKDLASYLHDQFEDEDIPDSLFSGESETTEKDGVTFDELRAGMIEDMRSLEALRDSPDANLDAKEMATVVARIADLRIKLVERMGTTQEVGQQRVVVVQKFNDICSFCGHEVAAKVVYKPLPSKK